MAITVNGFGLCATDYAGTGTGQCPIDQLGDFLGEGLLNKGTSFDIVDGDINISEAIFKGKILQGKLHQLLDKEAFEQNTPENDIYTSPEGLIRSIRAGKPQFAITYSKGLCFHKALYKLQGNNKYDHIFYFTKGMLACTNVAGDKLKGFNGGEFMVGTYMFQQGTEIEKGKATFQLKDAEEFNTRWVFLPYDILGFSPLEIDGVIDTNVKVESYTISISSGSGSVEVALKDGCNTSINYAELFDNVANWTLFRNGAEETISSVSINSSGNAVLTFASLLSSDVLQISLDGTQEDAQGLMYKSNTLTYTAV